jgi:hypothetical protein
MAGLSLRAVDADDLAVVASMLQDAVVAVSDMRYIAAEKMFVLVASRFCWETCDSRAGVPYERVHCGVSFEGVTHVRLRGIDLSDRGQFLDLLTIAFDAAGAVRLVFAGGGEIRLEIEAFQCHMRDLGEPWPTAAMPSHPAEGQG